MIQDKKPRMVMLGKAEFQNHLGETLVANIGFNRYVLINFGSEEKKQQFLNKTVKITIEAI